ncbi:MAG: hypothetical protein ACREXR_04355 [Gammaproteobacteria bacterium]
MTGAEVMGKTLRMYFFDKTILVNQRSMASDHFGQDNELLYPDNAMLVFGGTK